VGVDIRGLIDRHLSSGQDGEVTASADDAERSDEEERRQ
jgi:hypothetical protein